MSTGFDEHGYCFACDQRHASPACPDNYASFYIHMFLSGTLDIPYWREANAFRNWHLADGAD